VTAANDNTPRLVGRREAAAYLGIGESTFSLWVATHNLPPAVPGTRKWDRRAIDAKLDEISGLTAANDNVEDEFDKWERERDARKAQGTGDGKKAPRKR
jgi:predicted DNA-binding transcriptional regulator AlpA